MNFRTGSKVTLKKNAGEMNLGFDIDEMEAGKVYEVSINKNGLCLLVTGPDFFDRILIETKALDWAA